MIESIHVEFFGLPGCGKSTVSHELAMQLRKKGFNVEEPSYVIDHTNPKIIRKMIKLWYCLCTWISRNYCCKEMLSLVKCNGYKGKDAILQTSNLILKLKGYLLKSDFVVWDQGIVQAAISLSINENSENGVLENIQILKRICGGEFKTVFLQESLENVMRRLENRRSNDSRVEKEKDVGKRMELLKATNNLCNSVAADLVLTNSGIEEAVEQISNLMLNSR